MMSEHQAHVEHIIEENGGEAPERIVYVSCRRLFETELPADNDCRDVSPDRPKRRRGRADAFLRLADMSMPNQRGAYAWVSLNIPGLRTVLTRFDTRRAPTPFSTTPRCVPPTCIDPFSLTDASCRSTLTPPPRANDHRLLRWSGGVKRRVREEGGCARISFSFAFCRERVWKRGKEREDRGANLPVELRGRSRILSSLFAPNAKSV